MADLPKEMEEFYKKTLEETRKQIKDIDKQIEEEMAKLRQKLMELNNQKKAIRQIYDGAAALLGVPNEFEEEEGETEEVEEI